MPRPVDSGGPPHSRPYRMLLYCLRRTLKPSASAIAISKLYQLFRVRDHPYGLQDSLPTLRPFCSIPLIFRGVRPSAIYPVSFPSRGSFPTDFQSMSITYSIKVHLLHGPKVRYGWEATPYRGSLLIPLPTGTFTLQDTPSFARRDNDKLSGLVGWPITIVCYKTYM